MKNKKISIGIGVIIIMIITITVGVFVWKYGNQLEINVQKNELAQIEKENNDREYIVFCGKTYESDQIIINNIDIIKALAEISNNKTWLCQNLELGKYVEGGISIAQKKESKDKYLVVLFHKGNQREESDPFNQSPNIFRFNFNENQVFYQSQFDGRFNFLGDIK